MTEPKKDAVDRIQTNLIKTRIGRDLAHHMLDAKESVAEPIFNVILDFNRDFYSGVDGARQLFIRAYRSKKQMAFPKRAIPPLSKADTKKATKNLSEILDNSDTVEVEKSLWTDTYVFARLTKKSINELATWTFGEKNSPLIYKIWRDHEVKRCVYESVRTIKCDAARVSFTASGKDVVWAVADTGIDATHPHFRTLETLVLPDGLLHHDFTVAYRNLTAAQDAALRDTDGHGTHVAGIIAGRTSVSELPKTAGVEKMIVTSAVRTSDESVSQVSEQYDGVISGMAPHCKLLSLKVLERAVKVALAVFWLRLVTFRDPTTTAEILRSMA